MNDDKDITSDVREGVNRPRVTVKHGWKFAGYTCNIPRGAWYLLNDGSVKQNDKDTEWLISDPVMLVKPSSWEHQLECVFERKVRFWERKHAKAMKMHMDGVGDICRASAITYRESLADLRRLCPTISDNPKSS